MDEIEGVGWEPAPLPVERVRGGRPVSPSKEQPESRTGNRPKKDKDEDEEADAEKKAVDTYQREDEAEGETARPNKRPQASSDEAPPEHLIDITI